MADDAPHTHVAVPKRLFDQLVAIMYELPTKVTYHTLRDVENSVRTIPDPDKCPGPDKCPEPEDPSNPSVEPGG